MLVILGAIIVAVILFIVFYYIILASLTPGDSPGLVEDGDKAITKVGAGNVTFFGLVSFAIYKLFPCKQQ